MTIKIINSNESPKTPKPHTNESYLLNNNHILNINEEPSYLSVAHNNCKLFAMTSIRQVSLTQQLLVEGDDKLVPYSLNGLKVNKDYNSLNNKLGRCFIIKYT